MIPFDTEISSERLRLRKFSKSDIPFVFSASRYEGFCDGMHWEPPISEDELIAPYEDNLESWKEGVGYTFTIERSIDRVAVGRICIRKQNDAVWDFGFWTHPDFYGLGYMTEATISLMNYGFTELLATEIQASHAVWNMASRRVLEKAGFQFSKHIPKVIEKNGKWVDEDLLVISRLQWQQQSEQGSSHQPATAP